MSYEDWKDEGEDATSNEIAEVFTERRSWFAKELKERMDRGPAKTTATPSDLDDLSVSWHKTPNGAHAVRVRSNLSRAIEITLDPSNEELAEMIRLEPNWYFIREVSASRGGILIDTTHGNTWYPKHNVSAKLVTVGDEGPAPPLRTLPTISYGTGFNQRDRDQELIVEIPGWGTYETSASELKIPDRPPGCKTPNVIVAAGVWHDGDNSSFKPPWFVGAADALVDEISPDEPLDRARDYWPIAMGLLSGATSFSVDRQPSGKGIYSFFVLSMLIMVVMGQAACTVNSNCSPIYPAPGAKTCVGGQCVPMQFDGGPCDDFADCWSRCPCGPNGLGDLICLRCPSVTPTRTSSSSVSSTKSPTMSPTISGSSSQTRTPTASRSMLVSATMTSSRTQTKTATATATQSRTATPSSSRTGSETTTATTTQSLTPSQTLTPTMTSTLSPETTSGMSRTATGTSTATPAQTPSTTMTAEPTMEATASATPLPVFSTTGTATSVAMVNTTASMTQLPLQSPSALGTALGLWSASSSLTVLPSVSVTQTPKETQGRRESVWGSFPHNKIHNRNMPSSSSSRLAAFGLYTTVVSAARCIGTRLARTMAELQAPGATFNSTAGNYTYDSQTRWGIEEPTLTGADCTDTYSPPQELAIQENLGRSLKSLVVSSSPVFVYLDDNTLTLRFQDSQTRSISVSAIGQEWYAITNSSVYYITLPLEVFYHTNSIAVRTYVGYDMESNNAFQVIGSRPCIVEDCWLCNMMNWDCTPKIMKALLVVAVVLMCVMVIWCLCQCGALVAYVLNTGFSGIRMIIRALTNKASEGARGIAGWVESASAGRTVQRGVLLSMAVLGVMACDSSITITSGYSSCVSGVGESSCGVGIDSILTFAGPGARACVLFEIDGEPAGKAVFSYATDTIECDLVRPYYTSSFKPYSLSSFRCNGAGPCPSNCDAVAPRDAWGEFNSTNWIDYPGETRCTRRCQGIACGCILPASGCVYTTYSILPVEPVFRVSQVSVCTRSPVFTYEVQDYTGELLESGSFTMESDFAEDEFLTAEVLSDQSPDLPQDFPTHLMQGTAGSKLVKASTMNSPRQGEIGDIQATTQAELLSGNFTYDENILIRYDEKNKHDKVALHQPGILQAEQYKTLPALEGTSVWATDTDKNHWARKIVSFDTRQRPVIVGVKTKLNVTLTRVVNVVCPVAEFVSLVGCRECSAGAEAIIRVRSACMEGSVKVSGDGVVPTIIFVTKDEAEYRVVVRTNSSSYSETWRVGAVELKVEGDLEEGIVLGQEVILYEGEEKPSGSHGFKLGHWKWWEYLIFSIVCLAVIALLGWLVFTIAVPSLLTLVRRGATKAVLPATKVVKEPAQLPKRRRWDPVKRVFN